MKKLILLLSVFTISISFTYAQWQSTHFPSKFTITCIAASGTNIFAGTDSGGVFLSTDTGTTWTAVNNGLSNTKVTSLAVAGTNIFAGTGTLNVDGGVFFSTDTGISWTEGVGLSNTYVSSLAVIGTNIFAGTPSGVFLSTDTGVIWTAVNNGFPSFPYNFIVSLAAFGTNIFAGSYFNDLFLSTDSASTWTNIINNGTIYYGAITSLAVAGTNIFVGAGPAGIFLSTDTGLIWTAFNNGLWNSNVTSLALSGSNIFAGITGGVYLSTNTTGSTWLAVNNGLTDLNVTSLAIIGTNIFAGTDSAGVWKCQLSNILTCAPVINASSGTTFFCGGSVTLSDSTGGNYLWSDGETTSSIVVSVAGDYSCNVTTGCGTITSNIIGVIVQLDTISANGATTFCQGDSVTLIAGTASSYLWNDGETTQSIVVTTSSYYSCNITTPCGLVNTNYIQVTVITPPTATITPGGAAVTLCYGDTLAATTPPSFWYSYFYLWSNGATTEKITASNSQVYSVTVTSMGCSATSPATTVTVNPLPSTPVITASGATTVCEGDSVVLTSSAATGYKWSTGATTQSIAVKSTGNYGVTVTNANGCSASSNIQFTIHSTPVPPIIQQFHDSLKSSFSIGNQWYLNGNIISGATGQFYVPAQNGIYTVAFTNGNGCSSISAPFNITNVGITELISDYSFSIYPNPATNQLTIIPFSSSTCCKTAAISIMNILGTILLSRSLSLEEGRGEAIDIRTLPEGMYFLQMKSESGSVVKRFVKE